MLFRSLADVSPWNAETIESTLAPLPEALALEKLSILYQMLRVAVTGTNISPGIFETLALLDRNECLRRIELARDGFAATITN